MINNFKTLICWIFLVCSTDLMSAPKLKPIARSEAGLTTPIYSDFSNKKIHSEIQSLLMAPQSFNDVHFYKGLQLVDEVVIVTKRYKGEVFEGLMMGVSLDKIKSVLGKVCTESKLTAGTTNLFYTSKDLSVVFQCNANNVLESVAIKQRPHNALMPKTVLKTIIEGINETEELYNFLDQHPDINQHFVRAGINGGGAYAESNLGIEITSFFESSEIMVFNDFEGELYKYENSEGTYKIVYSKKDYQQDKLESAILKYYETEESFVGAKISPDGAYKLTYVINTSLSYYFIVRKNDYSAQDIYIYGNRADQFQWLNNNYFVLIDDMDGRCFVVNRNGKEEAVDIAQSLRIENSDGFVLGEVLTDYFTVKTSDPPKTYKIGFKESNHKLALFLVAGKPDKVISDIAHWEHPVKSVLAAEKLELYKVELFKSGTYPVFYVKALTTQNANNKAFLNQLAKQNSYWDFEIKDQKHSIAVSIDKKTKTITNVVSDLIGF